MRTKLLLGLGALALVVAGCGDTSTTETGSEGPTLDGDWILADAVIDGQPLEPLPRFPLTLTIDGAAIGGSAGCNSFGGTFAVDGNALELMDVAITEMACLEPGAMDVESTFINGFWRATTIEVVGTDLVIGGDDVSLTYTPVAPVADASLVETTWTLDTLIDGEAASSLIQGAAPVTLTLDGSGRYTAGTGCRLLEGDYELDGDALTLAVELDDDALTLAVELDDVACSGLEAEQEDDVLAVLAEPGLRVEIVENRLTLTGGDGRGLSFRAP